MVICSSCKLPVDDHGLALTLIVAPGIRGDGYVSTRTDRYDGLSICRACLQGDTGALLRRLITGPAVGVGAPRGWCEVRCEHPHRTNFVFVARVFKKKSNCPHCFGRAWVIPRDGAPVRNMTFRNWIFRRVPLRRSLTHEAFMQANAELASVATAGYTSLPPDPDDDGDDTE